MKRSERLQLLADRIRAGESIDWRTELDAMALEQAAQDAQFAEAIAQRRASELARLSGIGSGGSETPETTRGEIT